MPIRQKAIADVPEPSPEEWAIMQVPEPEDSYSTHVFSEEEIEEYRAMHPVGDDGGEEDV